MNRIKYFKVLLRSKLNGRGNNYVVNQMRKEGMKIGDGTHIFCNVAPSEPYLVTIGSNCTISTEVCFLTHDASIGLYMGRDNYSDICGRINIGDNCFIGNRAIVLYGVSIPNNTLVAAGSVVTKSIAEEGCIMAGNPAKVVGKVADFIAKNKDKMLSINGLSEVDRKNAILESGKLVQK